MNSYQQKPTNFFTGLIGALVGAAIGAALWMFVAKAGYIVSLVGLLIAVLAAKGYDICRGPQNAARAAVLIICVVLAVVGGNYAAICWQANEQYDELTGGFGGYGMMSRSQYREMLLDVPEVRDAFMKDTGVGLGFAALGCAGMIASGIRARKQRTAQEAAPVAAQEAYAAPAYVPEQEAYAAPAYVSEQEYDAYGRPLYYDESGYRVAYDENGYPIYYDENGYEITFDANGQPIYAENGYPAPAAAYAAADDAPGYAPADSDRGYSAGYAFRPMRTAAPTAPSGPAKPAGTSPSVKKNPFVKPEFSGSINPGKAAPKEPPRPAAPANTARTFYSDK